MSGGDEMRVSMNIGRLVWEKVGAGFPAVSAQTSSEGRAPVVRVPVEWARIRVHGNRGRVYVWGTTWKGRV